MKAQGRLGLDPSWPRITAVFLVVVAVLTIASRWPDAWQTDNAAWWVGVGVAVVVAVCALLTYRGTTAASGLATWVWDWSADSEATLAAGSTPAFDHRRRFSRDVVGVREYKGRLIAVIAAEATPDATSGRHHHRAQDSSAELPVGVVAAALRQFDVHLHGIDIISVAARHVSEAADSSAADYSETADDRLALQQRSTWLVLRLDPEQNVAAVATRDSVASTLAAAAERLALALDGRRLAVRPLNGVEIAGVDTAVLAGLEPTWSRPGWRHLKHFNGYVTSFWVSPKDITSETLHQLWLPETDATAVTVRLTPRHRGAEVSAWVRDHTDERLRKDARIGLNRLTGRQLAAVRASLPVPTRRSLIVPARMLGERERLAVPVGPVRRHSKIPHEPSQGGQ